MHRLQISVPASQHRFLRHRAHREGITIAEVIRRLIQHEEQARNVAASANSVWAICGIAEDRGPLLGGIPVSRAPKLYLADRTSSRDRIHPTKVGREGSRERGQR